MFASDSTGSVNHTVTSMPSPTPYGPLPGGFVVVMFSTVATSVDTTISRLAPSEQPLYNTHSPGSGRLILAAVAPYEGIVTSKAHAAMHVSLSTSGGGQVRR